MAEFVLHYPIEQPAIITQPFGVNRTGVPDFYTRWKLPAHEGIDFKAKYAQKIYAAADGHILAINVPGQGGVAANHPYGVHLKLKHQDGQYETDYCHLSAINSLIGPSGRVIQGQLIGFAGNTGNVVKGPGSDGTHLHFMLRKRGNTSAGIKMLIPDGRLVLYINDIVDPTPYFVLS